MRSDFVYGNLVAEKGRSGTRTRTGARQREAFQLSRFSARRFEAEDYRRTMAVDDRLLSAEETQAPRLRRPPPAASKPAGVAVRAEFDFNFFYTPGLHPGDFDAQFFRQPLPDFFRQLVMYPARALLGCVEHSHGGRCRDRHAEPDQSRKGESR